MAKRQNEKVTEAFELYKDGMKLVEIANRLEVPAGTIRRWKSTYQWDSERKSERSGKKSERSEKKRDVRKKGVADEIEDVVQNTDLTDKQRLFCLYYIRCFNATKAYQKAYGCDYATAMTNGSNLLRNTKVKNEILNLKQNRLNREMISEEDIVQRYIDIAHADMRDYAEIKGGCIKFKDSNEFDGMLVKKITSGKTNSIELYDSMKALQWLSDHMDLATEKQRAEIALLRAKVETGENEEKSDDGFIRALNSSAGDDWSDEETD